jgi:sec-independent protein translocase protein TatA
MFGIGGGELIFIIFIALMLFGADKVPDIARTIGKGMAQLKNATNEIKSEIINSTDTNSDDLKQLTNTFTTEVDNVKKSFHKIIDDNTSNLVSDTSIGNDITSEISDVKNSFDDLTGPIKRQK